MHVSLVIKNFKIHELENHFSCTEAPPEKNDASETLCRDLNFSIFESRMSILGFRIRPLPIQVKGMTCNC